MGGFKLKVEGLTTTLAKLDVKKYKVEIQQSFDKFGINAEKFAKLNAPEDEGHLKGAIFHQSGDLSSTVGCGVDYAAYLEFGTRKFAAEYVSALPKEWQELAAKYKGGGGGSFEEFVLRLTEWIHRKGLGTGFAGDIGVAGTYSVKTRKRTGNKEVQGNQDRQVAYLIARKILREGIRAQPFLYPAVNESMVILIEDLKKIKV